MKLAETGSTHAALLRAALACAPADVDPIDAELLLAQVLGRNRAGLYARLSAPSDADVAARFGALWRRRCAGEPYAYLVGEREFHGRRFRVDPSVLIPRPDTETLLEAALERWPQAASGVLVDAGTGSGVLAISFQLERPAACVLAVDASATALRIAAGNAQALGAPVRFWRGDWLGALADRSVDMLLSNPPYLAEDDPHLPELLRAGEPRSALVADDAGLGDLVRLADAGLRVLRRGGWCLCEHGASQGAAVRALLHARGYEQVRTLPDLAGRERVSLGSIGP